MNRRQGPCRFFGCNVPHVRGDEPAEAIRLHYASNQFPTLVGIVRDSYHPNPLNGGFFYARDSEVHMAANLDQLRETDFFFVKRKLHELYRKRRTAESKPEFQHANSHIHSYQEFLSDNGYPDYSEKDDLES